MSDVSLESITAPADDSYVTDRLERWRAVTDWPLMVIAIASLPILLLETREAELDSFDQTLITTVNIFVLVVFACDYIIEFSLARQRHRFVRHEWMSLLIVVAQILALLPALTGVGVLRVLRAGRLLRPLAIVLRGVAIGGTAARRGRSLLLEHATAFALGLAGMTWLTAGAAFTVAEASSDLHSFADGLWWSAATITTVGYGDVYPLTPAGRLIGGFTMIVGISTFALVTAKMAQFLVRDSASETT
jgi:voltage-gated potassium channel